MTPKQILDSFSETLLRDERILSAQERALLSALLQHAKTATAASTETQEAVRAVIASSVGEVVAQRAFAVLGGSLVERILQETNSLPSADTTHSVREHLGPKDPQPPHPTPPGTTSPRKEPHQPTPEKPSSPTAPQPPAQPMRDPQPPHAKTTTAIGSERNVAVSERPEILPARCVVLDEFLAPQEIEELMRYTLDHEADFELSEVISPHSEGGVVDYQHRSSRVLMDLGKYQDVIVDRIRTALPQILQKLGMDEFSITGVEAQITSSNDGDFFQFHADNSSERVASRYLTFVYFFHREPCGFEGGELRIHDARLAQGSYVSEGTYQTIVPQQNQIVLFPCELLHEITPVKCSSKIFADSRFTLNGWLRR